MIQNANSLSRYNRQDITDQILYKDIAFINHQMYVHYQKKCGFHSIILNSLDKIFVDENDSKYKNCNTAQIELRGINYMLVINRDFWISNDNLKKMALLIHEINHMLFDHLTQMSNYIDSNTYNISIDLTINTLLIEMFSGSHALPGCGDTTEWKTKHLPAIKSLQNDFQNDTITKEEYKEKLKKIPVRPIHPDDFVDKGISHREAATKGSNWIYNKLYKHKQKDPNNNDGNGIQQLHEAGLQHPSDHKKLEDLTKNIPDSVKKIVKKQFDNQVQQAAEEARKSIGSLPAYLQDIVDKLGKITKPVTDWKQQFRDWTGAFGNTFYVRRTKAKPNLLIPEGYRLRMYPNKHLLFLLDTSGSMNIKKDIPQVLKEGYNIHQLTKFQITVAECDTQIHDIWEMKSLKQINDKINVEGISGRGGTSIECINDFLNSKEHRGKYTGIVYLTDGEVSPPSKKPSIPLLVLKSQYGSMYRREDWEEQRYKIIEITPEHNKDEN